MTLPDAQRCPVIVRLGYRCCKARHHGGKCRLSEEDRIFAGHGVTFEKRKEAEGR
jgi:hypothetical protein